VLHLQDSLHYYEMKQQQHGFMKSAQLLDKRKKTMQWFQNPNQIPEDNMNNVRHEISNIFRTKRKYLKEKVMILKQTVRKKTRDLYQA